MNRSRNKDLIVLLLNMTTVTWDKWPLFTLTKAISDCSSSRYIKHVTYIQVKKTSCWFYFAFLLILHIFNMKRNNTELDVHSLHGVYNRCVFQIYVYQIHFHVQGEITILRNSEECFSRTNSNCFWLLK